MARAPLLLTLSALFARSTAQFTLTPRSPSVSVAPGGTVTLSCTVSGLPSIEAKYPAWYQQKHGNAPVLVVFSNGASTSHVNNRPSGIPARFSGSVSGATMSLTISGTQAEDDASYICKVHHWEGSTLHCIFGGGTQLNVQTGEHKPPTLSLFPPSSEEVATNRATLVCLMTDFYPGSVDVTWKVDDQPKKDGVQTTKPTKQSDNNLFMASSYLTVPTTEWSSSKMFTCEATHEGKTVKSTVNPSECV